MKQGILVAMLPFYLLIVIIFVGLAGIFSDTVTVVLQNQGPQRYHRIVIDAGHGGIDTGATSCTGAPESGINLEISLRLEDLFHFLGLETVMIRRSDTSVHTDGRTIAAQKISDLKERVRIVNETENAILVSIHQNTFSDSRYGGAQVFYANSDGSKDLANLLQSALGKNLNQGSNRNCKRANGVFLMENIRKTGLLIECGFLTNPEEEAKLRSKSYQQKLCVVIATVLAEYLSNT